MHADVSISPLKVAFTAVDASLAKCLTNEKSTESIY